MGALAKSEFRDPRATLRMGDKLSQCAEDTFEFTLKNCRSTFTDFSRCFERNPEQYAFDKCMSEHGQEKAKLAVREAVIKDEDVPWGAKPKIHITLELFKSNPKNALIHCAR